MFLGQGTGGVSVWYRVLISSANLFLNKRVLVGHPSVVHLDPTWVPCFTTKPIQTAAGLRCCTQRVEFQMSPLFCGHFLHSRASHWNQSPCWKLPAISKLDYKHMKLWIVQNVSKFSCQSHKQEIFQNQVWRWGLISQRLPNFYLSLCYAVFFLLRSSTCLIAAGAVTADGRRTWCLVCFTPGLICIAAKDPCCQLLKWKAFSCNSDDDLNYLKVKSM